MLKAQTFELDVAGRKLQLGVGKLAGQASGAVTVRYGETVVLVTVCMSEKPREGVDFLPLTVDYEERMYSVGKIPGGFIRREGRPSEKGTLASRLTDRAIRPLLPKELRNEVQIIVTVLSADQENDPDILGLIGASAALSISEVPFDGPISAVRAGVINGEMILNPTLQQLQTKQLEVTIASTEKAIVMIEAGGISAPEAMVAEAMRFAHKANQDIIRLQKDLQAAVGKVKIVVPHKELPAELVAAISPFVNDKVVEALNQSEKSQRDQLLATIQGDVLTELEKKYSKEEIMSAFDEKVKAVVRATILEKKKRVSGRSFTEIRPLSCEVGLLPRTHGSGLFTRGQTQVLSLTTLGSTRSEQIIDGIGIEETKRFMHHYNFPPYSTGETKRTGTPGRREIGHGALGEKALAAVVPPSSEFPYTIRIVSECLSSSGSTSMGSICASSLSMMDAGVPISAAVAGIAMGLVTNDKGDFAVLTDIEGVEDFNGDMDFKVAGTKDGVNALQMDTKLHGVNPDILEKALYQAKDARLYILGVMNQALSAPRSNMSPYAPRMYKMTIPQEKIGAVIGPGGKTIRSIIEQTKASIDIEDDGTVVVGSADEQGAKRAIQIIEGLTKDVEVGTIYTAKVSRILPFGAMVEILPGKEGLVHISELAEFRVGKVEDVVKLGDEVTVKVIGVDDMGRINLSRKALFARADGSLPEQSSQPPQQRPPFRSRPGGPPREGGGFRPRQ